MVPLRIQRVHTRMRRVAPLMSARIVWRFTLKTRLVRLLAWLTLLPTMRPFPQMSHVLPTCITPFSLFECGVHATMNAAC